MAPIKAFLVAIFLASSGGLLRGGDITGIVHGEQIAGAESTGGDSAAGYASRKYKFVERVNYAAMRDFVVYIDGLTVTNLTSNTNAVAVTTLRVAQHEAAFTPHVLPVLAGTRVEWPNNDDIFHNVFSDSDLARFDLGLYKGNPPDKQVRFEHAGRVDVFCSIHENMHCIVLVMANPYFATTDANGGYTITNVPPGTYKLKAWHERLPAKTAEIIVPTNGVVHADFTLNFDNLPTQ